VVKVHSRTVKYYVHGAFMWIGWTVIGMLQIWTNRYMRAHWRWNKVVHSILGFAALALILTSGFVALQAHGWRINRSQALHTKAGFCFFIIGTFPIFIGIAANIMRLKAEMAWKSKRVLLLGKTHKWLGRACLLVSQYIIGTGTVNFFKFDEVFKWTFPAVSAFVFLALIISSEIWFRMKLRK